jgi:hypothetical protein
MKNRETARKVLNAIEDATRAWIAARDLCSDGCHGYIDITWSGEGGDPPDCPVISVQYTTGGLWSGETESHSINLPWEGVVAAMDSSAALEEWAATVREKRGREEQAVQEKRLLAELMAKYPELIEQTNKGTNKGTNP